MNSFWLKNSGNRYRDQKADPVHERIFGVFVDGDLAATARYTKHPDGVEMDCVFVPETYRGKGYARYTVEELIRQCGLGIDLHPFNHHPNLIL